MSTTDGNTQPFRVLSLDGGGVKGAYTASLLASLEEMTGKRVADYFDLITGTSTGGIIAVGLGLGLPAQQIRDFYIRKGPVIFPSSSRRSLVAFWRRLRRPKLCPHTLRSALSDVFGKRRFGESKCRLVIPAFDGVRGGIQLFKTAHASDYKQDYRRLAIDVAMGTSAAPTFYPAYSDETGGSYLDGGVWANCPVMVGLLEATCVMGNKIEDVEILSIGTTSETFEIGASQRSGGLWVWRKRASDLFMHAQAEAALGQAKLMTTNRLLRLDTITSPGRFSMDDSTKISDLCSLGKEAARLHETEISRRFLFAPAGAFEPFYENTGEYEKIENMQANARLD